MPRTPGVHWDRHAKAWRSDVGPRGETGRRRPVYFREAGDPPRHLGPRDKALAREALEAYLETRERAAEDGRDPSVAAVCELYLAWVEAHLKPRTYKGHVEMLSLLCAFVPAGQGLAYGGRRAREFGAADLNRMEREWKARGLGALYRRRLVVSAKACWAWAARQDPDRDPPRLIPENGLADARKPAAPEPAPRYAARAEVAGFLRFLWRRAAPRGEKRHFDRAFARLVQFCARTGCRPGEARKLRWTDIRWEDGLARQLEHKTSGKTGRPRLIILPPPVLRALRRLAAREGRHPEFVFTHRRGNGSVARGESPAHGVPWGAHALAAKMIRSRTMAIAAGVPLRDEGPGRFTLYLLRHTSITDAVQDGDLTPAQAAELHGTGAEMVRRVYAHIEARRMWERQEALRRARRRPPPASA